MRFNSCLWVELLQQLAQLIGHDLVVISLHAFAAEDKVNALKAFVVSTAIRLPLIVNDFVGHVSPKIVFKFFRGKCFFW